MTAGLRKHLCVLGALAIVLAARSAFAQMNVAYVEVNDNALSNAGCYTLAGNKTPFFNMAMIFAANINGDDPNRPEVFFNPQVTRLLNETAQVKELQGKGVKVSLTLLGNHKNAGWSCVSQPNAAKDFADKIADVAQKYGLDGIDIDDEYSNCSANDASMIMIAKALVGNAKFKGKILSKALFNDTQLFQATSSDGKLADFLNYGWEMTYGAPSARSRLQPYLSNGMSKSKLAIGLDAGGPVSGAEMLTTEVKQSGFAGVMVYNVSRKSGSYLSAIGRKEYNQGVNVDSVCLR
jgi:GH18 family chitinase